MGRGAPRKEYSKPKRIMVLKKGAGAEVFVARCGETKAGLAVNSRLTVALCGELSDFIRRSTFHAEEISYPSFSAYFV